MKCVHIYKDGSMDELELTFKKKKTKFNINNLSAYLMKMSKSQGEGDIKELYKWTHENKIIKCFSWYDGEAGFENKHELPPGGISCFLDEDSSVQLLFGDIFLVLYNDDNLYDFQISDYGVFYNFICDGFDDCNTEDEEEEKEEEEEEINIDEDYIDGEGCGDTDEEYEILSNQSEDLDIDTNEY